MNGDSSVNHMLLMLVKQSGQLKNMLAFIQGKKATIINKQQQLGALHNRFNRDIDTMIATQPANRDRDEVTSSNVDQQTNDADEFTALLRRCWKIKQVQAQLEGKFSRARQRDKRIEEAIKKTQTLIINVANAMKAGLLDDSRQSTMELLLLKNQLLLNQHP